MQNYHPKVYFLDAKTVLKQQEVKVYIDFCEITLSLEYLEPKRSKRGAH